MNRYVCIHGHFYQPPRENAWLETIELQDSAYPYHDWNERITAECYAPNAASRILDDEGRIHKIVNNYARISFNFGPTLLSWMEARAPETYAAILAADRDSQQRFNGHGSAMAQPYNHMILPLANHEDKRCQVAWGVRDFEQRFGRRPEGIWLPETAVNVETLEVLAEAGLRYTILDAGQASRIRPTGSHDWQNVDGGKIDPSRPYEIHLPSGARFVLFFYDGPVSRAVAFERLLAKGETFAHRLLGGFSEGRDWPQLMNIATDGETYGHHHRHGEMALTYALDYLESQQLATLTNYAAFLEQHLPTHVVEVWENSSWSCAHGVERWYNDCGCSTGAHPDWNQAWRGPLRAALDWLRDELIPQYEQSAGELLHDPWAARRDYIEVILDRSAECRERYLARHASRPLQADERIRVWKLLELQRHAMLMYTSCGWFFDELSGIETVQVMQYAGRAVQLGQELFQRDLESGFLERLQAAKSNLGDQGDGRQIYERYVKPAMVDLRRVGAHYAVSSLFESYETRTRIYGFRVDRQDQRLLEAGRARLALGKMNVRSEITEEAEVLSFGVLHFGDHNLTGGVRQFQDDSSYDKMIQEVGEAFSHADLTGVMRLLDRHFLELTYSLRTLFRDEQRRIVSSILKSRLEEAAQVYGRLYKNQAPLMRYLTELGTPLPIALRIAGELVLNTSLRTELQAGELDMDRIRNLLEAARLESVPLDSAGLSLELRKALERAMVRLRLDAENLPLLQKLESAVRLAESAPFEIDLWRVENLYFEMLQDCYPAIRRTEAEREASRRWLIAFVALGDALNVRVD
jgi:alpha-amylase/alpha-mannosidase (GH57 family)